MLASHRMIKPGHPRTFVVATMASSLATAAALVVFGRGLILEWPSMLQGRTHDVVLAPPGSVRALDPDPIVLKHLPPSPVVHRTKSHSSSASDPSVTVGRSRPSTGTAPSRVHVPPSHAAEPDPIPTLPSPVPTPSPTDPGNTSGAGGATVCVDLGILSLGLGTGDC